MNTEELLFALLRLAVCGEPVREELLSACTDEALDRVYVIASQYDIAHLVGQALGKLSLGASKASDACKQRALQSVYRYVGMSNAYETVCQLLEEQKIFKYIKGENNTIMYTDLPKQRSITFWL